MTTTARTSYPELPGDLETDVAVIGGGMAGLCTAWELARAGRSVVLLEADRVAAGVSGHTTAKLTAQHTLVYAHLRATYGAEAARRYATSQQEAVEHVAATVAELGIDCDLERCAAYTYAASEDRAGEIRAEVEAAREAGLDATLVTSTELPYPVAAAVRVEGQAQFHPRRFLLALAEDFVRMGGRIHERTRVTGLSEGEPCRLTALVSPRPKGTGEAVVTAREVVVTTHYPVFDRALLFARLEPRRELVVAGPVPEGRAPQGMYITPEGDTRSVRTAPYDTGRRLLIVTGEKFTPGTPGVAERFDRLSAWARGHFPVDEITHHWATQDNFTTDNVPYVGRFHAAARHAWVATGFGGWGMSGGAMAGRLIATLVQGGTTEWERLYDPRRVHPVAEAGAFLKANAANAKHFVGDRLRGLAHSGSVADIPVGGGAVLRMKGERCAVHRGDDGRLYTVAATCTHLGCIVAFNDAERTWDCPCHGSRFGIDGGVVHGPATEGLEPRDLDE